jgi:hypothetical protein
VGNSIYFIQIPGNREYGRYKRYRCCACNHGNSGIAGDYDQESDSIQWLEKMKEEYTASSERAIHGEVNGETYDEESNQQSGEVSFFRR